MTTARPLIEVGLTGEALRVLRETTADDFIHVFFEDDPDETITELLRLITQVGRPGVNILIDNSEISGVPFSDASIEAMIRHPLVSEINFRGIHDVVNPAISVRILHTTPYKDEYRFQFDETLATYLEEGVVTQEEWDRLNDISTQPTVYRRVDSDLTTGETYSRLVERNLQTRSLMELCF